MNNSTNLWQTIKKIVPNKTSSVKTPTSISNKYNEHLCSTSSKDIVYEFNKYFTSIGNELGSKFNDNDNVKCPCNSICTDQNNCTANNFKFSVISSEFVRDQICNMQNNKSAGLDQFTVRLLELAGPFISNWLAHICNLLLSGSTFPDDWKKAKVTPIFKSGDK